MSEQTNTNTEEDKEVEKNQHLLQIEGQSTNKDVEESLYGVLERIFRAILSPEDDEKATSLFVRIKKSFYQNLPLIPEASRNSTRNLLIWTRQGTALRALLVISIGTIVLLALSGLLVFMVFFVAATVNAIIISLLISVAAAGGCLAIFFTCMTAIYIGALSVAVFVISSATITTIFAVLIATGWIGFFWTVWIATKKGMSLAKHSLSMTGSALSAYSASRQTRQDEPGK
ncbi:hypothetical protein IFM89_003002 [Coptis chinensis]|uniref:Uncharacterized protein n=1 Tax=Coptis chinensis TaxID=261450 RepID=A0A835IUJ4_9MAGN|nr:hypothetical protein IFM89_003002 [Coptis chinensis]